MGLSKPTKSNAIADKVIRNSKPVANGLINGCAPEVPKRLPVCPPEMPQLHGIYVLVGHCGAGKTNTASNFIRHYFAKGALNKIHVISPTADQNGSIQAMVDEGIIEEENIYSDHERGQESLEACMADIKKQKEDFDYEEKYKKAYKAFFNVDQFGIRRSKANPEQELMVKMEMYREPKELPWPSNLVLIDDMVGSSLLRVGPGERLIVCFASREFMYVGNPFNVIALSHRHIHGVGCTILINIQSYKACPKQIRRNANGVMIFHTLNIDEIDEMYKEQANGVTKSTFYELLMEAIRDKDNHSFLFIDKKEKDLDKQFRKNFDLILDVDHNAERALLLAENSSKAARSKKKLTDFGSSSEVYSNDYSGSNSR